MSGKRIIEGLKEAVAIMKGEAEPARVYHVHTPRWQDISTAPKDGTKVLLYGIWAGEIHWQNEEPTIDIGRWAGGKSGLAGDDWWELVTGDQYACWMRPTHWMPLPTPPEPPQGP